LLKNYSKNDNEMDSLLEKPPKTNELPDKLPAITQMKFAFPMKSLIGKNIFPRVSKAFSPKRIISKKIISKKITTKVTPPNILFESEKDDSFQTEPGDNLNNENS
jgi:hypothetical protein